jgi:hypothetical protein
MIGVRNALERRSGGATVPVGAALIGTPLAAGCAVRDGGLRRQPLEPHRHPQALRSPVPAQHQQPERALSGPSRQPGTQQGRLRDNERLRRPGPREQGGGGSRSRNDAPGGCPPGFCRPRHLLVSFVSGPAGQAAISHYLDTYQSVAALVIAPTALVNFGEAVNFPLIFGAMLAVFGAATLVHLLVESVSRRRRETCLLKALGFVNGQVAATVAWQATTVAIVGIVPVSIVQGWLLAALIAGVLVAANLLAALPALAARRSQAGQLLRTQ